MKRLFTALIIVIVVLTVGLTALVLLINPDSFRGEITRQVERSSGYQLVIDGSLRWHVWPQLSILAGRVTATAPGAPQPIATADNVRLDVKLWPLLSHQLAIKQVLLKGAIIRLTPESRPRQIVDTPSLPSTSAPLSQSNSAAWQWNIDTVQVSDGLLVWQQNQNQQVNVRDLNLLFERESNGQGSLQLSGTINRDQRDLTLSLKSELQFNTLPANFSASISDLNYSLQGAGLPTKGFAGQAALQVTYQMADRQLRINPLNLTINEMPIQGQVSVKLGDTPAIDLSLAAEKLNIDQLLSLPTEKQVKEGSDGLPAVNKRQAVVSGSKDAYSSLDELQGINVKLVVKAGQLSYRDISAKQFHLALESKRGYLTLQTAAETLLGGSAELTGSMAPRSERFRIELHPKLDNVELKPLLTAFKVPPLVTGKLSMQGNLQHSGTETPLSLQRWQGKLQSRIEGGRLYGFNIQQLIQQVAERSNSGAKGKGSYERYTDVRELVADGVLKPGGNLQLTRFSADSNALRINGTGVVNLLKELCDLDLRVQVLGDWSGKAEVVRLLSTTAIPLRIYGPWKNLSYQVDIEQLLRDQLKSKGKRVLDELLERVR